ncbi:DUF947-domain-containing protein [Dothidotthia symphoricarpi CBS 119687]|uniref:rRNA biogenesis protein RRP36 n=1 Tax=Dothidotthia symphoricarpi CBS 119687 TaxID=1392245 RepID=A0A6A6AAX6_9PLEO|nr:DUF947-domain-containing protein [Dothidotthia symphoricarpi CBS 119687]KAF2128726.1 DUF947-domain-containing protein [Dothidotthia symphoricarpi CBS 119687]
MPLSSTLARKLRAADDSSDGEDYYDVTDRSSSASILETGAGGDVISSDGEGVGDDDMVSISNVSFGALAKAQAALDKDHTPSHASEDKLEALRERLRQIKADKSKSTANKKTKPTPRDEGNGGRGDSDSDAAPKARPSKHAPAVQSSKRMVSRKRQVVDVKKPVSRDPRFENINGPLPDDNTIGNRYGFLDDYRKSEIADLRSTIRKSKNEGEKERLKRQLLPMESQQKTRENKEAQQHVIRNHKQKEKELVKQGKQPFYLKKSEQKKIALIDRFQNMKSKQRDHVIERRRKKVTAKERRNMPAERRAA